MKLKSLATLLFFLISLALFINDGLAKRVIDTSTAKQSESGVVQPEWFFGWGRLHPYWGLPIPRRPIPGHAEVLPPLPSHHPWWPHPPAKKGSNTDISVTEQKLEIAKEDDKIDEQDDSFDQEAWFFHPYVPRFGHPFPGFRRPFPGFRRPFPGWGALPPKPAHQPFPGFRRPFPGWGALPPKPAHH